MIATQFEQATPVTPAFPNWKRSFVSGPESTLFQVEHRLASDPASASVPTLISKVNFKAQSEGPPGHVHGGASAGLIDEVMGILVWNQKYPGVTQSLNLKYLKALPLNEVSYVMTQLTSVHEKTIEVECTILNNEKTPYVSAQGVFHRLTQAQLDRFTLNVPKN